MSKLTSKFCDAEGMVVCLGFFPGDVTFGAR
jgi:hypothetical protein